MIRPKLQSAERNLHESEAIKWLLTSQGLAFEMILTDLNINPFTNLEMEVEDENGIYSDEGPDPLRAAIFCAYRNNLPDAIDFADWFIHLNSQEFEQWVHESMIQHFPSRKYNPKLPPSSYEYEYLPMDFLGISPVEMSDDPKLQHKHTKSFIRATRSHDPKLRELACILIERSLRQAAKRSRHAAYLNVAEVLSYLYSKSRENSLYHDTEDEFWDNWGEAPYWDQLEEIQELQDEAYERYEIMSCGLKILESSEDFSKTLIRNYRKAYRYVEKRAKSFPEKKLNELVHNNKLKELIDDRTIRQPKYNWPDITLSSDQSLTRTQYVHRYLRQWRNSHNEGTQLRD